MNNTTPAKRRALARSIASQLENNQPLIDDLHAELAARSMEPITPPEITEDLDDHDSDLVKENLAMADRISVNLEDFTRMKDALLELTEPTWTDDTGTIWEKLAEIEEDQFDEDESELCPPFTITKKDMDDIKADMTTKLEAIQKMVEGLED